MKNTPLLDSGKIPALDSRLHSEEDGAEPTESCIRW